MAYRIGLKILQLLPPEMAHNITINSIENNISPYISDNRDLSIELAGLKLSSPIGLAAGFDKDARVPEQMLKLGFGFVECGTVTPLPQKGNPKPRMFRLSEDMAVINAMGFNNGGIQEFVKNLRLRSHLPGVVGANIGANKDSVDKIADYVLGVKRVWTACSYITMNISSPNTKGLRDLQSKDSLDELLTRVNEQRNFQTDLYGKKPVFLKVAPDLDDTQIDDIANLVINNKIDALIVSNTTLSRPDSLISNNKNRAGGLSGKPVFELSTQKLKDFHSILGDKVPLIGVGGICSGADAIAKLEAGAKAIQLYTALAYRGPNLLLEIRDAIAEYMNVKSN